MCPIEMSVVHYHPWIIQNPKAFHQPRALEWMKLVRPLTTLWVTIQCSQTLPPELPRPLGPRETLRLHVGVLFRPVDRIPCSEDASIAKNDRRKGRWASLWLCAIVACILWKIFVFVFSWFAMGGASERWNYQDFCAQIRLRNFVWRFFLEAGFSIFTLFCGQWSV